MYFVLNTRENVSPFDSFEILERIVLVFTDFCGVLSEGNIRKNLLLLHELIDEFMDFGYVQESAIEPLVTLALNKPLLASPEPTFAKNKPPMNDSISVAVPLTVPSIFVNLQEVIEVLFDGTGVVRKASLEGQLIIRNFMNLNPKISMTFNGDFTVGRTADAASNGKSLDYCTFNECVSFSKWDSQRTLEIAKCPSGTFTLLKYLVIDDFQKPFSLSTLVEEGPFDGQLDLVIKVATHFDDNRIASNVTLTCPIPKCTQSVNFSVGDPAHQECEYDKAEKRIRWKLDKMTKGMESSIRVKLGLGQEKGNHKRELGPLSLSFDITNHIYANVAIKSFNIEDAAQVQKWMMLKTKSLSYESRVDFSHSNRSRVK